VTANLQKVLAGLGAVAISAAAAGCGGEFVRDSRSPVRLVIEQLQVGDRQNTLLSDVITLVRQPEPCTATSPCPTVRNDVAVVEMRVELRDQASPGSAPSALNAVTINRYRVKYRRADQNNIPGVDVPYDFDSAFTLTVPASGSQAGTFQIVRHSAKEEAPLAALRYTGDIISTIAEVTFYGTDQAGNEVSVSSFIGIDFGDFGDSAN
jgi:hypothetical protein